MEDLRGRAAVVTGGASGIGRGVARALAAQGADVVVADIDGAAAGAVVAELAGGQGRSIARAVDVTRPAQVEALAAAAEEAFGAVHILVNNAGVMTVTSLAEATAEDWSWVFNVNLHGVVNCVRAFLPLLRRNAPAHIVNTASMAGVAPRLDSNLGIYSASKAAVIVYSEVLRAELEADRIGVSVLCPGPVRTRIWEAERNRPVDLGARRTLVEPTRASAGLDPDEVGRLVVEGVLDNSAYIFTNAGSRERIEERADRLRRALDELDRRTR